MVILHLARLTNNLSDGVSVAVKNITKFQSFYCEILLYDYSTHLLSEYKKGVLTCITEVPIKGINSIAIKTDLLIFHSPFDIPYSVLVSSDAFRNNIPYIIVPHGCFSREALKKKWIKKMIALHTIYRSQIKKTASIQYLSEGEQNGSFFINNKNMIVPNGIESPPNYKKRKKAKRIVFLGRKDIYHKGIDLLLEACSLIRELLLEANVTIKLIGPDFISSKAYIDNIVRENGLQSIIINLDAVYGEEKKQVFKENDIFILTSRFEGQPTSILEAMSYGMPILATKGTNMAKEILTYDCGWVAENDSHSIAQILNKAIHTSENVIETMSINSRKVVDLNYNWMTVEEKAIKNYQSIIGDNK